jgi:hypothetical protein
MRPVMLQNIDATEHGVRIQWQNEEFFTELRLQHDKQMHDLGHYGRLSFESWTSDISGRASTSNPWLEKSVTGLQQTYRMFPDCCLAGN